MIPQSLVKPCHQIIKAIRFSHPWRSHLVKRDWWARLCRESGWPDSTFNFKISQNIKRHSNEINIYFPFDYCSNLPHWNHNAVFFIKAWFLLCFKDQRGESKMPFMFHIYSLSSTRNVYFYRFISLGYKRAKWY